jgi:hypothetical protein
MELASACSVCNEKTHISRRCPILHDVLGRGFYSGAAKGYRDEEEDDHIHAISEISINSAHNSNAEGFGIS